MKTSSAAAGALLALAATAVLAQAPAGVRATLAAVRQSVAGFEPAQLTLTVALDRDAAPLRGLKRADLARARCVVAAGADRQGKWATLVGAAADGAIDLLPGESFTLTFSVALPEEALKPAPTPPGMPPGTPAPPPGPVTLQWVGAGPLKDLRSNELPLALRDGKNPTATLETSEGTIVLELIPEWAPNHVANFVTLAEKGFYDGLIWHRTMPNFMVQTGCPKGDGTGDAGYKLKAEFNEQSFTKGVLGMARGPEDDTAGSQFFVCVADSAFLNKKYTAFGRVLEGQDVADRIANLPRTPGTEKPMKDVLLKKATIARPPTYVLPEVKKA
jgi:peptidyl-prolyl cis-trans isomerase B (cyclophilin B)